MKVTVIGGSGYTGRELIRILDRHSEVKEVSVTSTKFEGRKVSDLHPSLDANIAFTKFDLNAANASDLVFCCIPHTKAMKIVPKITTKVIDLSADYRLNNAEKYQEAYNIEHTSPELLEDAVYGLPEYYRKEISKARLVANPGCYPTSIILGAKPLLEKFPVMSLIADSKSGISGAGRGKEDEMKAFISHGNVRAYKIVGHQHIPEIEQELEVSVLFTPHLVPVDQGIFSTLHAITDANPEEIKSVYERKYESEPFVEISDNPDLVSVRNTNLCKIGGFESDGKRVVITSTIDNLIKGAAGQAVQNMNIMFGYEETSGLV